MDLNNTANGFSFSGNRSLQTFRDADLTPDEPNFNYEVISQWSVNPINSETFEIETPSFLMHKYGCWTSDIFLPRWGEQTVSGMGFSFQVQFDTRQCDNTIRVITQESGSFEFTLEDLFSN